MPVLAPARVPRSETLWYRGASEWETEQGQLAPQRTLPTRLHSRQVEPGPDAGSPDAAEYLGSHAWSPEMVRYLANEVVRLLAEEKLPYSQWHQSPYVVQRLQALVGSDPVAAVLLLVQRRGALGEDGSEAEWRECHEQVAAQFQRSLPWLFRQEFTILALARGTFGLLRGSGRAKRSSVPAQTSIA